MQHFAELLWMAFVFVSVPFLSVMYIRARLREAVARRFGEWTLRLGRHVPGSGYYVSDGDGGLVWIEDQP